MGGQTGLNFGVKVNPNLQQFTNSKTFGGEFVVVVVVVVAVVVVVVGGSDPYRGTLPH